ncbi:APC family permease [Rhizosaccharibacter radicis]|uniref:APC family permease n=1 Tax=Rhizosaccharibacter radicis TaxID=2782605 RepID=A0ABT1W104_9PROT|nr:APC family permease [Acetobacteraceae bacterium KSS12]
MQITPKREIGAWPLLFTGLGSIIGSGWLFGAERAAVLAGPGAIIAWLIGGCVVLVIAGIAAELGGMFPVSGGAVRFSRASHGGLVGFISAWANWLAIASAISVEAEASIQYMSSWPFSWTQGLFHDGELTPVALLMAGVLVVVYFLLNFWSVKLFARSNAAITVFKLVVPALTGIALIAASFHPGNVSGATAGGFLPNGAAGILTAVATSGIIFAFNGFQSPLNLAGEARNPDRTIPFAVLGSVALAFVVYVLLQVAYLGAVDPGQVKAHGWSGITFSSPFAQLALAFNLNWLAVLLYFDAFLSPSGTGTTYMATTSRMIVGAQRNGTAPAVLGRLHPVWGVPRPALWFNLGVAFVFLYFFRGWGSLAAVISVTTVICYMLMPMAALTLRRNAAHLRRPIRMPGIGILGPVGFVMSSLLLYWARWPLTGEIILLLAAALPIYVWYRRNASRAELMSDLRCAWWLVLFLPIMALLSFIGSREFGGIGLLPYGWDMAVVAVVSLLFCFWGTRSGLADPQVDDMSSPDADLAETTALH